MLGTFLQQGPKMREWPKSPIGFFRGVYCGESSPKFKMYNENKTNGALARENQNAYNKSAKNHKNIKSLKLRLIVTQKGNWERLWGRGGRFPSTHISTPKFRNCEIVDWLNGVLLWSFRYVSRTWLTHFEFDWGLLYWTWGDLSDCFWSIENTLNPKVWIKEVMVKFDLIG